MMQVIEKVIDFDTFHQSPLSAPVEMYHVDSLRAERIIAVMFHPRALSITPDIVHGVQLF